MVSTLRSVTEAFATTDPVGSRTIPVTEPAESWAFAEPDASNSVIVRIARKANRNQDQRLDGHIVRTSYKSEASIAPGHAAMLYKKTLTLVKDFLLNECSYMENLAVSIC